MTDTPDHDYGDGFAGKLLRQYDLLEFGIDYDMDDLSVWNKENELLQMFEDGWRPFTIYWRKGVKFWGMQRDRDQDPPAVCPQPLR